MAISYDENYDKTPALTTSRTSRRQKNDGTGDFSRAVGTFVDQTQGLLGGLVGLAGDVAGVESVRDWGYEKYASNMEEAQQYQKAIYDVDYLLEQGEFGDWVDAAQHYASLGGLNLITALASGGVGSSIAKHAVAKTAAKKAAAQITAKKVAAAKAGETLAAAGSTAALRAAAQKEIIGTAATRGAYAGLGASAFGQELGATYGEAGEYALEQGGTLDDIDTGRVVGAGLAAGSLEFAGDVLALGIGRMLPGGKPLDLLSTTAKGTGLKAGLATRGTAAAKGMVAGAVTEIPTEMGQTTLERYGAGKSIDPEDEEYMKALRQTVLAAGFGGMAAGTLNIMNVKQSQDYLGIEDMRSRMPSYTEPTVEPEAPFEFTGEARRTERTMADILSEKFPTTGVDTSESATKKREAEYKRARTRYRNSPSGFFMTDPETQQEISLTIGDVMDARDDAMGLFAPTPEQIAEEAANADTAAAAARREAIKAAIPDIVNRWANVREKGKQTPAQVRETEKAFLDAYNEPTNVIVNDLVVDGEQTQQERFLTVGELLDWQARQREKSRAAEQGLDLTQFANLPVLFKGNPSVLVADSQGQVSRVELDPTSPEFDAYVTAMARRAGRKALAVESLSQTQDTPDAVIAPTTEEVVAQDQRQVAEAVRRTQEIKTPAERKQAEIQAKREQLHPFFATEEASQLTERQIDKRTGLPNVGTQREVAELQKRVTGDLEKIIANPTTSPWKKAAATFILNTKRQGTEQAAPVTAPVQEAPVTAPVQEAPVTAPVTAPVQEAPTTPVEAAPTVQQQTPEQPTTTQPAAADILTTLDLKEGSQQRQVMDLLLGRVAEGRVDDILSYSDKNKKTNLAMANIAKLLGWGAEGRKRVSESINAISTKLETATGMKLPEYLASQAKARAEARRAEPEAPVTSEQVAEAEVGFEATAPIDEQEAMNAGLSFTGGKNQITRGANLNVKFGRKGFDGLSEADQEAVMQVIEPTDPEQMQFVDDLRTAYDTKPANLSKGQTFDKLSKAQQYQAITKAQEKAARQAEKAVTAQGVMTEQEQLIQEQEATLQNAKREAELAERMGTQLGTIVTTQFDAMADTMGLPKFKDLTFGLRGLLFDALLQTNAVTPEMKLLNQKQLITVLKSFIEGVRSEYQAEQETRSPTMAEERVEGGAQQTQEQAEGQRADDVAGQTVPEAVQTRLSTKVGKETAPTGQWQDATYETSGFDETESAIYNALNEYRQALQADRKDAMMGILDLLQSMADQAKDTFYNDAIAGLRKSLTLLYNAGLTIDLDLHDNIKDYYALLARQYNDGRLNINTIRYAQQGVFPLGSALETMNGATVRISGVKDNEGNHGLNIGTVLHELTHAVSHGLVNGVDRGTITDPQAIKQVDDIKKLMSKIEYLADKHKREIPDVAKAALDYGTSNVHEFITLSMTDKDFNDGLKYIDDIGRSNADTAKKQADRSSLRYKIYELIAKLANRFGFATPKFVDAFIKNAEVQYDPIVEQARAAATAASYESPILQSGAVTAAKSQQAIAMGGKKKSGLEAAVDHATVQGSLKETLRQWWIDPARAIREVQLGWMTMEQIADRVKNDAVKAYVNVIHKIQRTSKQRLEEAHAINNEWANLETVHGKDAINRMHELMEETTRKAFDPTVDDPASFKDAEKKAEAQRMLRQFNALPKPMQEFYAKVRDYYTADFESKYKLMEDAILSAEAAGNGTKTAELRARLAEMRQRKGPYFPLKRLGKFYAVGMSQRVYDLMKKRENNSITKDEDLELRKLRKDGKQYRVESFDSLRAATARSAEMQNSMGKSYANMASEHYDLEARQIPNVELLESYFSDSALLDDSAKGAIRSILAYMYADLLPESTGVKSQMRREGVAGATIDMRRVFADVAITNAHQLGRLTHAHEMNQAMKDVGKMGKEGDIDGTMVANQLKRRSAMVYQFDASPVVDFMMTLSYFAHLGLSPAYWLTNMTQVPMITGPWLAARYGTTNSYNAVIQAYRDTTDIIKTNWDAEQAKTNTTFGGWRMDFDWQGKLDEGESTMMEELLQRNKLDITLEHDLAAVAKGADSGFGRQAEVVQFLNTPVRISEIANRAVTALSTYRLETAKLQRQGKLTPAQIQEKATEAAILAVTETQLDYSGLNAPLYMQSVMGSRSIAKLMFQFRKYQQGMVYLVAKNVYDGLINKNASKEEIEIARRTLVGLLMTTGSMAGAIGIPFAGSAIMVANAISNAFGEDDEPADLETDFRNYLTDMFGATAATAIMKGIPAAVGVDVSKRIGMGDLGSIAPYAREGATPRESITNYLVAATGAPVSMGIDFAEGAAMIVDGDVLKGSEKATPIKFVKNLLRASRYGTEGMTDSQGEPIFPADKFSAWDLALRASGFSTSTESRYYDAQKALMKQKTAVDDARASLIRRYAQARLANDNAEVRDLQKEINEFNKRHKQRKGIRITPKNLKQSLERRRDARKERGASGIKTGKQYQPYQETIRFAEN